MEAPEATSLEKLDLSDRGHVTNRYLSNKLPPTGDTCDQELVKKGLPPDKWPSVLEVLCLELDDIRSKQVLDVGIGGGRAFEQAQKNKDKHGWEYYGVEIAHVVRGPKFRPAAAAFRESIAIRNLERLIQAYPEYFRTADAAKQLPFPDNSMDIVLSAISLPNYARNSQEAITSILEMIRVSRNKVVFTTNIKDINDPGQLVELGVGKHRLKFAMKRLFDELVKVGVSYELRKMEPQELMPEGVVSAHLDVSNKNNPELLKLREELLTKIEEFTH